MTREEAITNLNMISVAFVEPITKEQRNLINDTFEMAIKALEQEPCNDVISRQAVLEYIEGSGAELGHGSENELVCQDIKELPPVIPQPKWIPVSERLPDTDDEVLCWYEYYHWSLEKILPEYGIGKFFDDKWFGEVSVGKDVRVIAWMPLPEPYKAESEVRNEQMDC